MILSKTLIKSRINEVSDQSGIDSLEHALNKDHFINYPYKVEYKFNSRGFRDYEWPNSIDELRESIWCIGDSFTSGVGVPFEHTWPQILRKMSSKNVINVSLDGASNPWITRQTEYILEEIKPKIIVIQWSYINRRERSLEELIEKAWEYFYNAVKDPLWPIDIKFSNYKTLLLPEQVREIESNPFYHKFKDELDYDSEGRINFVKCTLEEDLDSFRFCLNKLADPGETKIIHTFIPFWHLVSWNESHKLYNKFNWHNQTVIKEIRTLDYARDSHHYDIKTATELCNLINQALA